MHCRFCGGSIDGDSKFCRNCGEYIETTISQPKIVEEVEYSRKESFASKMSKAAIELVVGVLILINFLSGIVGGIWLTFSGGLSLVIYGILLSIIMPWGYTLAFLPQAGLMALFVKPLEKGNKILVTIVGLLASSYGNLIIAIWIVFVFQKLVVIQQNYSLIPLLLWGYSTAMAPLSYMASKEPPDSTGTSIGLFFAQLSYLILTVLYIMGKYDSSKNRVLGILIILFSFVTISFVLGSMKSSKTQD